MRTGRTSVRGLRRYAVGVGGVGGGNMESLRDDCSIDSSTALRMTSCALRMTVCALRMTVCALRRGDARGSAGVEIASLRSQ